VLKKSIYFGLNCYSSIKTASATVLDGLSALEWFGTIK